MENEQVKTLNISPLKKGKRMLTFLGDFFIMFIISFVFMNVAVVPILNRTSNIQNKLEDEIAAEKNCMNILYGNKLLSYKDETEKYQLEKSLEYSSTLFLSYYVFDAENLPYENMDAFGHKDDNEFFLHYYIDIKNDLSTYISNFKIADEGFGYFVFNDNDITLKSDIKNQLVSYFDPKDDLSSDAELIFNDITETIYLNIYSKIIDDICLNNLSYNGLSYIENNKIIVNFENIYSKFFAISSLISYFISWVICYVIIPLANKNGKTLTMIILKQERIGMNNLYLLKKGEVIFNSIYQLVFNLFFTLFLPLSYVSVTYLFSIVWLPSLSIIGLLIVLLSFILILFNKYNRSLSDVLSRSVLVSSADLDEIYRAKGYKV